LANAQVAPESIDYIEAHGTGTSLGDPIEIQALSEVHQERQRPLYISSTKTYIGHLEAAAGIAGVIRTVLSLQHQQIPAHKNFNTLNPLIDLTRCRAEIPLQTTPWNIKDEPRRAGVSSFGFSGTNAHIILEEAPQDYQPSKQALPLTEFKRQRYWFSEQKTDILPYNCFYTCTHQERPLSKEFAALHELQIIRDETHLPTLYTLVKKASTHPLVFVAKENTPEHGLYLGFTKVLQWEHPEYKVRCIVFDSIDEALLSEELHYGHSPMVFYRNHTRYEPHIGYQTLSEQTIPALDPQASYWITGGFGGLGLILAQWLADNGAKHLLLTSRKGPTEESQQARDKLTAQGVTLHCHALDSADATAVNTFIEQWPKQCPQLKGLFHLAGTNLQKPWDETSLDELHTVLTSKKDAAWQLHELTQKMPLDYFVLFSSLSSFIGSNRQAAYVVANSCLDTLGSYRKTLGLPATVINWGPFSGAGMIGEKALHAAITPAEGMQALSRILAQDKSAIAVVKPQFLKFMFEFHPKPYPAWLGIMLEQIATNEPRILSTLTAELAQLDKETRRARLADITESAVRAVLGSTDALDDRLGFFEMGLDSLMAVALRTHLQDRLGLTLTATMGFDYPTIQKVVDYLEEEISQQKQILLMMPHQAHHQEPIAIIGMSGRFPGGANTVDVLWDHLKEGIDGISTISRWDPNHYEDTPTRAGFVDYIDQFDAAFFGISPKEARAMDPQQRMLLEETCHALESAALLPKTLEHTDTGVFVGISQSEYATLLARSGEEFGMYGTTGNALNVAAGRIAYIFGLQGKTMAIDTACSSSLVAIHEACQSLREGETSLAIAAGVNAILVPEIFQSLSKAHMLSPTGTCHTFDAQADGYARGEGCGVLILKRLSDAEKDGDPILALIRGSAVNQDGASSGLTVPNGVAQAELIQRALVQSGMLPEDIDYIEAHGTGTSLGDPIEMGALHTVFAARTRPLVVGSVKASIGHLESAAGITGIIKTILSLNNNLIPKQLHCNTINPHITLDNILIPTELYPWEPGERIRRAGVSSFGFSGTNAHVILEEAPSAYRSHKEPLPITQFKRERYWVPLKPRHEMDEGRHPFLQHQLTIPDQNGYFFESIISSQYPEFIPDHKIYGMPVVAGAGYLSTALSFARDYLSTRYCRIQKVEFIEALVLENSAKEYYLYVQVLPKEHSGYVFKVYSQPKSKDVPAQLRVQLELVPVERMDDIPALKEVQAQYPTQTDYDSATHRACANRLSLQLEHHFHWNEAVFCGENSWLARLRTADIGSEQKGYVLYPGLIDSSFQSMLALSPDTDMLAIPLAIEDSVWDLDAHEVLWSHGHMIGDTQHTRADIEYYDGRGVCVGRIIGFKGQRAPKEALARSLQRQIKKTLLPVFSLWIPSKETQYRTPGLLIELPQTEDTTGLEACNYLLPLLQKSTEQSITIATSGLDPDGMQPLSSAVGALLGLIKSLRLELPELDVCLLSIDNSKDTDWALAHLPVNEPFVSWRNGSAHVLRLFDEETIKTQEHQLVIPAESPNWQVTQGAKGQFETLFITETPEHILGDDHIEIAVRAVGLNFRDVLNALDMYPGEAGALGGDCAGVVTRVGANVREFKPGDPVFGIALGALRSHALTNAQLIAHLPASLNYAQGASLPVIMMTAHYGLTHLAHLRAGQRVLIHTAAGGVGLLAIQLAQHLGAEIYATASTGKHAYLQSLGIQHLYDSRSTAFAADIMRDTQNTGVDLVLNTLTSEGFIEASLSCLKKEGIFVEISKPNSYTQKNMKTTRPDVHYHIIAIDTMFTAEPYVIKSLLNELLALIQQQIIKPPLLRGIPLERLPYAMNTLREGHHIGKLVIMHPTPWPPKGHLLISGGLGALGGMLTHWLQEQGVAHLSIISRSKPKQPEPGIDYYQADIAHPKHVEAIIQEAHKKYPLTGVFHLAGVLDDGIFAEQTPERFKTVWDAKVLGALNLHKATQAIPLDYFVLFSSIASSMGSPGQTNYAAANSALDQLAMQRQQQGLPAQSIQWGPWLEAGMAAHLVNEHARKGIHALKTQEALNALKTALHTAMPSLQIAAIDWNTLAKRHNWLLVNNRNGVAEMPPAYFEYLFTLPGYLPTFLKKSGSNKTDILNLKDVEFYETLKNCPDSDREPLVRQYIHQLLRSTLELTDDFLIDDETNFFEMGMDSLMAMEMSNRIQHAFGFNDMSRNYVFEHNTVFLLIQSLNLSANDDAETHSELITLTAESETALFPLSSVQKRMWHIMQINPDMKGYNQVNFLKATGDFDREICVKALELLVKRHPSLATIFLINEGIPFQKVVAPAKIQWDIFDLKSDPDTSKLPAHFKAYVQKTFDLNKGPLLRTGLFYISDSEVVLCFVMQHLIADAWSFVILSREFTKAYQDLVEFNEVKSLPKKELEFSDYVIWEDKKKAAHDPTESLHYWKDYYELSPTVIDLPTDNSYPDIPSTLGDAIYKTIPATVIRHLEQFNKKQQTTLFITAFSVFQVLMHRFSQQGDILIGTTLSNRPDERLNSVIAMFAEEMVLRSRYEYNQRFLDFLQQTKHHIYSGYKHQDVSFSEIIQVIKVQRVPTRSPLYQVHFHFHSYPEETNTHPNSKIKFENLVFPRGVAHFDIDVFIVSINGALMISCEYNTDVFTKESMQILMDDYERFLISCLDNPEVPLDALQLSQPIEQRLEKRALQRRNKNHLVRNHCGCACANIETTIPKLVKLCDIIKVGPVYFDPLQNARVCLLDSADGYCIELVEGDMVRDVLKSKPTRYKDLPVDALFEQGMVAYHLCFEVSDIKQALQVFSNHGATLVSEPKPAILFNNRLVAFIQTELGLIELLENKHPAYDFFLEEKITNLLVTAQPESHVIVSATFTAELLEPSLMFWINALELPFNLRFTPYNQVFQELLNPHSTLNTNKNGINTILLRLEDWLELELEQSPIDLKKIETKLKSSSKEFILALQQAPNYCNAPYWLVFCPITPTLEPLCAALIHEFEQKIAEQFKDSQSVHTFFSDNVFHYYPVLDYYNEATEKTGHIPYHSLFFTALGTYLARHLYNKFHKPFKVIAVDCDNTLWDGVCAEEGPAGIRITPQHSAFQQLLLEQQQAGKLLCLCSKNEEQDV
ncbi:MAG: SDR family NAD(P)-dependent oxidoreductase, partial [Legionellales bacterium]